MYAISSGGSIIWQITSTRFATQNSPALSSDGILYFSSGTSYLYALSTKTGSTLWTRNHVDTSDKSISASIGLYRFLYIGSYDGKFYAYQSQIKSTSSPSSIKTLNEIEFLADGYQVDSPWWHFRGNSQGSGQSYLNGPLPLSNSNFNDSITLEVLCFIWNLHYSYYGGWWNNIFRVY